MDASARLKRTSPTTVAGLTDGEDRLLRAIMASPVPMLLHAEDGAVLHVNDAWCDHTGCARDELTAMADWCVRAGGEPAEARPGDGALHLVKGRQSEGICQIRTRAGTVRSWNLGSAVLGHLPDGRRLLLSIAMGVSGPHAAEQNVERLETELEQRVIERTARLAAAGRELETLFYAVAHDLRAPMRALDGFSHILASEHAGSLTTEGRRVVDVIRAEARRVGRLLDDLLGLSRMIRQRMWRIDLDLEAVARDAFNRCLAHAGNPAHVHLELHRLPRASGDWAMVGQVFENLISNAIKFAGTKDPALIEIEGRVEGDEVVCSVKDNGVGFDMRYAGKLFGVFQRLHRDAEFEGTGAGLAIVQRIIHRHGGRVWADGKVNEGATFHFTLPRHEGVPGSGE